MERGDYMVIFVPIKQIKTGVIKPNYAHLGDSGMDVFSPESFKLQPMERRLVPCGFCVSVPRGFELQVRPKSGRALKEGLTVLNTPGTIDAGYHDEVGVLLINLGDKPITIAKETKIAQLVLCPVVTCVWKDVDDFSNSSERGLGGWGSTGLAARPEYLVEAA